MKPDELSTHWSPVGWYVAVVLMRFEWDDEDKTNPNRRCLAWENQILITAGSPEEAYDKALEHGRLHEEGKAWDSRNKAREGHWRFEGLTSLLAVYDEPSDGSEITWTQHESRSVRKVESWAKSKDELEVFQQKKQRQE